MALFNSDNKHKDDNVSSSGGRDYLNSNTMIGANTKIEGNITCQGNLRIDGELHGNISCENKLIIGGGGIVHGNIHSKQLDLEGKIYGDVKITSGLKLKSKSYLQGNIELFSGNLEIEHEAIFNGICEMNKKETSSPPTYETSKQSIYHTPPQRDTPSHSNANNVSHAPLN